MKVWIVKGDYNGRWCFDAENSSTSSSLIYDFQDKGIVRDWKKARVSFESVLDNPIFYLNINNRDHAFLPIYATDEFKEYVENCGITGFSFREVFDFDDPDKEYPLM